MEVSLSRGKILAYSAVLLIVGCAIGIWLASSTGINPAPRPPINKDDTPPAPTPSPYPDKLPPGVVAYSPPAGPKVPGLELPEAVQINSIHPVPIMAKTEAKTVKWIVSGQRANAQPHVHEIPGLKMLLVTPAALVDDTIVIFAYTSVGGEPTEPAVTAILVRTGKPEPAPKPEPIPDPPAKTGKPAHITFIFDYAQPTPAQASVRTDAVFRKSLEGMKIAYHEMSVKSELLNKPGGLQPAVRELGGPPVFVVQDENGNIIYKEKFKDVKSTEAVLNDLLKQGG
jgi:hypothetical protein